MTDMGQNGHLWGSSILSKSNLSPKWMLFLLAALHLAAALGHFLLSVLSKAVARDIHYGTQACFPLTSNSSNTIICLGANESSICGNFVDSQGTRLCDWDYTGLGLDYQLLVGPCFMAVYTVTSIFWGLAADRYDRVHLLASSSLVFSVALILTAFATTYWHLVLLRMLSAVGIAGISPIAPGIIYDSFSEKHRGIAMSIFHWGIYLGGGFANGVGKGVTDLNIFEQGWRGAFLVSGFPGLVLVVLMLVTGNDPPRTSKESIIPSLEVEGSIQRIPIPKKRNLNIQEEEEDETEDDVVIEYELNSEAQVLINDRNQRDPVVTHSLWQCLLQPTVFLLGFGACIRQAAGYTWGYNSALYFQTYYPNFNSSWWLTWITIFGGTIGVVFGGFVSDRLVSRFGLSARALVLAVSQILAAPFALGTLWLNPPAAFISLLFGYLFAEMWYGVVFVILVELLPPTIRSFGLGLTLFIINNFGGNIPVIVAPLSLVLTYRGALTFLYPGALLASSLLFFAGYAALRKTK